MKLLAARTCLAALALCLFDGTRARADFVDWSYNWTPSAPAVLADNPSMGQIKLLTETAGTANGFSFIVAANLKTVSGADPQNPAVFTNTPYGLTLNLTDGLTGKTGKLTFTGTLTGTLSSGNALLTNKFTGDIIQATVIGDHLYTAAVTSFAPPGPPSSTNTGSIGVLVGVTPVPEPSTLALSGLGLSLLGVGWWRRRRARPTAICRAA